jgi:hypothetical protein
MENLTNILFSAAKETNQLFFDSLSEMTKSVEDFSEVLDKNFAKEVDAILESLKEKSIFSPEEFYWVEGLEKLFYLAELSSEYQETFESSDELEEELFDFFTNTEFFEYFNEAQKNKQNVWESAADIMSIMQNNLLAFYYLQLSDEVEKTFPQPLTYFYSPEMGDFGNYYYIKGQLFLRPEKEDFLRLTAIKGSQFEFQLASGRKELSEPSNKMFSFETAPLKFRLSHFDESLNLGDLKNKTVKALETIQEYAPNCFNLLRQYSEKVILVKEENVVSYSMQNLPKYSFINIFDRDDIDLIDDFIHENGHHILNSILCISELINEDDEKIFYSPWRRSLRPIRGIYHAYCTFYWALELFSEMYDNNFFLNTDYSGEEKLKLIHRIYEEFLFLVETEPVLKQAHDLGKITETGWKIIMEFKELIHKKAYVFNSVKAGLESSGSEAVKKMVLETNKTIEEMGRYRS